MQPGGYKVSRRFLTVVLYVYCDRAGNFESGVLLQPVQGGNIQPCLLHSLIVCFGSDSISVYISSRLLECMKHKGMTDERERERESWLVGWLFWV